MSPPSALRALGESVVVAGAILSLVFGLAAAARPAPPARATATMAPVPPVATPAPVAATPAPTAAVPAETPSALVQRGRALFVQSCTHCHGHDATGDEGPDLHRLRISDAHIALLLQHGLKGEMPSFAQKHDAADVAALTAYLRTLR